MCIKVLLAEHVAILSRVASMLMRAFVIDLHLLFQVLQVTVHRLSRWAITIQIGETDSSTFDGASALATDCVLRLLKLFASFLRLVVAMGLAHRARILLVGTG